MTISQGLPLDQSLKSAKKNVYILSMAQAALGAAAPLSFAVGALAGYQMLGEDKALATAPITGFNIGTAVGAVVIAIASRFLGRKLAFILGSFLCASGAALSAIALIRQEFWLFAIALLLIGVSSGFTQKIRFAAADVSPSFFKPRAISWILAGGAISAVLGPQLAILAKDLLAPITFAGSFVMLILVALMGSVFLSLVQLPKPVALGGENAVERPLHEIISNSRFITGMVCGIGAYSLMTFLMVGAPLAMVIGCGFSPDMASLGIQWHVLAMFLPSFFTGMLITKFGSEKIVTTGFVLIVASALVAHQGQELWNFWLTLVLVGLGWNFAFIGSTAIIASSYRPQEADKVQGFHDIILFSIVALSSIGSGYVYANWGWDAMNLLVWPVIALCLPLLIWQMRKASMITVAR
jgi:predicted MFS family arabinose efflux permease